MKTKLLKQFLATDMYNLIKSPSETMTNYYLGKVNAYAMCLYIAGEIDELTMDIIRIRARTYATRSTFKY